MQGKKNKWLMCGIFQQNQKRVWANLGIRIIKGIQKIVSLNIGRFLSFFIEKRKMYFIYLIQVAIFIAYIHYKVSQDTPLGHCLVSIPLLLLF